MNNIPVAQPVYYTQTDTVRDAPDMDRNNHLPSSTQDRNDEYCDVVMVLSACLCCLCLC